MKILLPLFLTTPLILGTALQAQSILAFEGDQHWSQWPASLNALGAFGRGVSAQFTLDGAIDVLQLDGSELVLLTNPDEFFAGTPVRSGVTDLAPLPGAGLGGLDAVAVVGAAGLERLWYDPTFGDFGSSAINSSTWAGAELVRSADLNQDGVFDLIGVASDSQRVLVQMANSSGSGFQAGAGFQARADVRDLVVLQWDADSSREVAVLNDLAVDVYDLDGTLLKTFTAATPGGALCALGQAGNALERLAWITEYAPPALQYLVVLTPAGVANVVDLGALDAFAVVPTDSDLDGDDDLLISHKYSYELLWIKNQRTPQTPNAASFVQAGDQRVFQVEGSGSAPGNKAWPVVADLDGDGDDDVSFASEGSSRQWVFRGEAVNQDALRASVDAGDYTVDMQGGDGVLNLVLGGPASLPAAATHLELRAWRQADSATAMDVEVLEVQTIALPGNWPLSTSVTLPETDADFADNYHVHLRLVELDASGGLVQAYPSAVGTFGLLAADRAALAADQPTGPAIEIPTPAAVEPEKSPNFTSVRRLKIPPPPPNPGFAMIPKYG